MSSNRKILFITTSHIHPPRTPTGVWFEELTTPYYILQDAGIEVDIASVKGGKMPIDPRSLQEKGKNPASVERFFNDDDAKKKITFTPPIEEVDAAGYEGIFFPGGHGTMWDFPENEIIAKIVSDTLAQDKIVSAVCHGPASLVSARFEDGTSVVKGKKISAFTNTEEEATGLKDEVPFLLETKLEELGATIEKAPDFEAFAIADGNLITGQNPASSEKVAKLVVEQLGTHDSDEDDDGITFIGQPMSL